MCCGWLCWLGSVYIVVVGVGWWFVELVVVCWLFVRFVLCWLLVYWWKNCGKGGLCWECFWGSCFFVVGCG